LGDQRNEKLIKRGAGSGIPTEIGRERKIAKRNIWSRMSAWKEKWGQYLKTSPPQPTLTDTNAHTYTNTVNHLKGDVIHLTNTSVYFFSEYFANFGFGSVLVLVLGILAVFYLWQVGA